MNPVSSGYRARLCSAGRAVVAGGGSDRVRSGARTTSGHRVDDPLEEHADLPQGGPDRQVVLGHAEQDELLAAKERRSHEDCDLVGGEATEVDTPLLFPAGDLGQQLVPATEHAADGSR